jgi:hypothetical protein
MALHAVKTAAAVDRPDERVYFNLAAPSTSESSALTSASGRGHASLYGTTRETTTATPQANENVSSVSETDLVAAVAEAGKYNSAAVVGSLSTASSEIFQQEQVYMTSVQTALFYKTP